MINPQIFYTANCDNCNKQWQDYSGMVAFNDKMAMDQNLRDSDWLVADYEHGEKHQGKTYCPDCYSFEDEDQITLKDTF